MASIETNQTERLLREFTQQRFCAVFIDSSTQQPIKNLPVYGELVLTSAFVRKLINFESKYLKGQLSNLQLNVSQQQLNKIEAALEEYLTNHYGTIVDDDFQIIMDDYADAIYQHLKSNGNFGDLFDNLEVLIKQFMAELIDSGKIMQPHVEAPKNEARAVCPFGYLATDQVGYISYDISEIIKIYRSKGSGDDQTNHTHEVEFIEEIAVQYWLYPNGKMNAGINVSAMGRVTSTYVFGNSIAVQASDELVSRMAYQSMQNPSLIDWYLSSSSFSVNPKYLIGEDGCERLFPANFATSEFRFFQIVRGDIIESAYEGGGDDRPGPVIRHGFAYEYSTVWQPLGHTVGQIIYSLPLAPGEIIKIGIIDWKRNSEDTRTEDTQESEDLTHDTFRDRSILETVKGALSEWQRGGSVMAGNSGGAGVSYGIPIFGASAGNAHSFGGGYSTSSGDRDLTVNTVQQVSDAFSQHSTSIRELRSTVVVQSDQQEYARAETRVIANNNHAHALTMLYYEVLRHFKVATQFVRRRNTLLIKYDRINFGFYFDIWTHRQLLTAFLKDESLKANFGVIERFMSLYILEQQKPAVSNPVEYLFNRLNVTIGTGTNGAGGDIRVYILLHDGRLVNVMYPMSEDDLDKSKLDTPSNDYESNTSQTLMGCVFRNNENIKYGDIKQVIVSYSDTLTGVRKGSWSLAHIRINAFTIYNQEVVLADVTPAINLNCSDPNKPAQHNNDYGDRDPYRYDIVAPVAPPQRNDNMAAYNSLNDEEKQAGEKLKRHLLDNAGYYSRLIWLNEDINDRAQRFEQIDIGGNFKLIDRIENRPIDVLGDYVVFPSSLEPEVSNNLDLDKYIKNKAKTEKLMTLPSRGVFAEAKLGNCNASEIIDNTRFWDWQQSPILEKAPEIDAVNTDSRNVTQNLTPTAFPQSIVNIVNPTPAPDPTGMAGALALLGKGDAFRDMSMSAEVTDLLKKLSDNSVEYAQAANEARNILSKQNTGGGGGSADGEESSGSVGQGGGQSAKIPNLTPQEFMDWMNAVKNAPQMTDKDQKEVVQDIKDAAKSSVNPKPTGTTESPRKNKIFMFKAKDHKGNNLDFDIKATIHDILKNKTVVNGVPYHGHGQLDVEFEDSNPEINIYLETTPVLIDTEFIKVSVPAIRIDGPDNLQLKGVTRIVYVTLRQKSITYSITAKSKDEAAEKLTNQYGGKLGFNKVVAAEILTTTASEKTNSQGEELSFTYSGILPDNSYELNITQSAAATS